MRVRWMLLIATAGLAPQVASAAPYVAVDAGAGRYVGFLDQGTLNRSGNVVHVEMLAVIKDRQPILSSLRFDCAARTWQQLSNREVAANYSIGPAVPEPPAVLPVREGTIAYNMLERACFGRQVNTSGGWTRSTLREAVEAGRAALANP